MSWPILAKPVILTVGIVYLALCLGTGFWAMRLNKSAHDFFAAGKNVGIVLLTFGTFAALLSGTAFIGGPGFSYAFGFGAMWFVMGPTLAFALTWFVVARKFRKIADKRLILSVPDIIHARFGSNLLRFLAGLGIFIGVMGFLSSQIMATGWVMVTILGLDFKIALLIGLAVVGLYSITGGVIAGLYTDVVQGIAMLSGTVVIAFIALTKGGGLTGLWSTLATQDVNLVGTFGTVPPMLALSSLFITVAGTMGQPHVVSRFFMVKGEKTLRWGALTSTFGFMITTALVLLVGPFIRAKVILGELEPLASPDMAALVFLMNYLPDVIAGIVLAAMLGAIMSTTDAFLNVGAAALVRDMAQGVLKRPIKDELLWGRIATVILLAGATLIALGTKTLVALLGLMGAGLLAAVLTPVLAFGLNWKRATTEGAIAAVGGGILVVVVLELLKYSNVYALPGGFQAGPVGIFVGTILMVGVSLLTSTNADKNMPPDIYEVIES